MLTHDGSTDRDHDELRLQRIDQLIIVAAPSCCGKSTLIRELRSGNVRKLATALAMDAVDSWFFVDSDLLDTLRQRQVPRMVLHYALPALPIKDGLIRSIADDSPMDILQIAKRISIVTLFADSDTLLQRIRKRIRSRKANRWPVIRSIAGFLAQSKSLRERWPLLRKRFRLERLEKLYADPDELSFIYRSWFSHCQQVSPEMELILHTVNGYTVTRITDEVRASGVLGDTTSPAPWKHDSNAVPIDSAGV